MTQFIQQPGMITIAPDFSGIALDKVPSGYYRIAFHPDIGYFLAPVEPLQVADKIYGNLLQHLPRIEEAFANQTDKPLSVMLEGLKGSGKSLLMKTLAKRFVENEDGIVLMCNSPFTGDGYFEFLQKISQKKIVLMDEFDKVYKDKDDRNNILTLLDGNFASHTMFVLTMNADLSSGNFEFFHNRPGRVMFNIKFAGVPEDAIRAYAEDHLQDQTKVLEVVQFVKRFTDFNMDMLGKLINEVNHCPHLTLEEITTYLNVKPDLSLDDVYFIVKYFRNGLDVSKHIHGCIQDHDHKRMLKAIGDPSRRDESMNLMLTGRIHWNETQNREWNNDTDLQTTDVRTIGQVVQVARDKKELVKPFDEYLYASGMTRTQDTQSGEITLTTEVEGNKWSITMLPQVAKKYKWAF